MASVQDIILQADELHALGLARHVTDDVTDEVPEDHDVWLAAVPIRGCDCEGFCCKCWRRWRLIYMGGGRWWLERDDERDGERDGAAWVTLPAGNVVRVEVDRDGFVVDRALPQLPLETRAEVQRRVQLLAAIATQALQQDDASLLRQHLDVLKC